MGPNEQKSVLILSGMVLLQQEGATMISARRSMSHVAEKELIVS